MGQNMAVDFSIIMHQFLIFFSFAIDNNNNVNINNFNMASSKSMGSDDQFWELIFGVDILKNDKWQNEFHNNNIKCGREESMWDIFKSVNNEVLQEIQQIILKNPGCSQLVKCEGAYFVPYQIKK